MRTKEGWADEVELVRHTLCGGERHFYVLAVSSDISREDGTKSNLKTSKSSTTASVSTTPTDSCLQAGSIYQICVQAINRVSVSAPIWTEPLIIPKGPDVTKKQDIQLASAEEKKEADSIEREMLATILDDLGLDSVSAALMQSGYTSVQHLLQAIEQAPDRERVRKETGIT